MLDEISILPIFEKWPIWVWLFGLLVYFIPVRLAMSLLDPPIRGVFHDHVAREYWPSFKWGSTIFIPLYLGFAAAALQDGWHGSDAFYVSDWYNFGLLVAALLIAVTLNRQERMNRVYTDDLMWRWSKLFHMLGLALALHFGLAAGLPLLLTLDGGPNLWTGLAFVSLVGFGATVWLDQHPKFRPEPRYTH
jgi:hypothetical protein